MSYAILTHGGAASPSTMNDGCVVAAEAAQKILVAGGDALAAALAATVVLEDDEALRAVEIGAGDAFTCARTEDGRVICWGDNAALQLGDPSSETTRAHREIALGC